MGYFARTEIVEIYRQKLVRSVNRIFYQFEPLEQSLSPIQFASAIDMKSLNAKENISFNKNVKL